MLINDFFFPAHSAVVLKAESVADKVEWLNKLRNVIQSKGGQVIGESGPPMRHSMSDGSLVSYPVMFIVSFPPLFFFVWGDWMPLSHTFAAICDCWNFLFFCA